MPIHEIPFRRLVSAVPEPTFRSPGDLLRSTRAPRWQPRAARPGEEAGSGDQRTVEEPASRGRWLRAARAGAAGTVRLPRRGLGEGGAGSGSPPQPRDPSESSDKTGHEAV